MVFLWFSYGFPMVSLPEGICWLIPAACAACWPVESLDDLHAQVVQGFGAHLAAWSWTWKSSAERWWLWNVVVGMRMWLRMWLRMRMMMMRMMMMTFFLFCRVFQSIKTVLQLLCRAAPSRLLLAGLLNLVLSRHLFQLHLPSSSDFCTWHPRHVWEHLVKTSHTKAAWRILRLDQKKTIKNTRNSQITTQAFQVTAGSPRVLSPIQLASVASSMAQPKLNPGDPRYDVGFVLFRWLGPVIVRSVSNEPSLFKIGKVLSLHVSSPVFCGFFRVWRIPIHHPHTQSSDVLAEMSTSQEDSGQKWLSEKIVQQKTGRSIDGSSIFTWLVVDLPLWKIWKSVGMIIPNIWKNKSHVPNHQPVTYIYRWRIAFWGNPLEVGSRASFTIPAAASHPERARTTGGKPEIRHTWWFTNGWCPSPLRLQLQWLLDRRVDG